MLTEWVVQNPHATKPLRMPLNVECNTPEDKVLANVLKNSRHIRKWVKTLPAHDGVAVIVGGGPSLADTITDIPAKGGKIFALNGAAKYLNDRGIKADYQVIMDAKPETATLVGPAKDYLFASQVDPKCFRKKPQATLWHASYGALMVDEQEGFPAHDDDYAVIGASVSVGNTCLVLCYALGYRKIHVFGMDSSHREGSSHAYRQSMNDGDPCTLVEINGKRFVCSVTMDLQARYFLQRAAQLKAEGVSIEVHGSGLLPEIYNNPLSEADKYKCMWARDEYRAFSPGEHAAKEFLGLVDLNGRSVIDFGCGTGRGSLALANAGAHVVAVDFADNCRDEAAQGIPFEQHDLTKPLHRVAEYGYCTDVMEHIPTEDVSLVISNIMRSAPTVFFQISTVPDSMGSLIGRDLHLTVEPHDWWRRLFERHGYFVAWQKMEPHCSAFLVKKEKLLA
jgi:hypothetical protein